MGAFKDITGMKFHHLTVIEQAGRDKYGKILCKAKKQDLEWVTNIMTGFVLLVANILRQSLRIEPIFIIVNADRR